MFSEYKVGQEFIKSKFKHPGFQNAKESLSSTQLVNIWSTKGTDKTHTGMTLIIILIVGSISCCFAVWVVAGRRVHISVMCIEFRTRIIVTTWPYVNKVLCCTSSPQRSAYNRLLSVYTVHVADQEGTQHTTFKPTVTWKFSCTAKAGKNCP